MHINSDEGDATRLVFIIAGSACRGRRTIRLSRFSVFSRFMSAAVGLLRPR